MYIRIKYKSAAAAEKAGTKLPLSCVWHIVKDSTTDVYLEVPESYLSYVYKYLNPEEY